MEVNRITIKGFVGSREVRNPGKGNEHFKLSVCVNEEIRRDRNGRPVYDKTWFDVVGFDSMASRMDRSGVKVGDFVEVIGKMKSNVWGEGPNKRVSYNIIANNFGVIKRKKVDG